MKGRYFILLISVLCLVLFNCRFRNTDPVETKQELHPAFSWQIYKSPEEAGFSSVALEKVKKYVANSQIASLFVVYKGNVLLALGEYQRRFQCHSIRKSLMNAVIGTGYDEGRIDLNKTLNDLGIDDLNSLSDDEKRTTIRHMLQSRSGVYHPAVYETPSMERSKPKRYSKKSGDFWYYNNWDFNVLSTIVEKEMGDDFLHIFTNRIAHAIGMEDFREFDGHYFVDSTVSFHKAYVYKLSARDLARFGLLYLQNGLWEGRRILSEEWIRESTTSYSETNTIRGGYGYLWWIPIVADTIPAFAACGVGTQVLMIIPDNNLVIVQRINTYLGKTHPFDHNLYRMVISAKVSSAAKHPELIPLSSAETNKNYSIPNRSKYVGNYLSGDGLYKIIEYEDGLLLEYPKGLKALLIQHEEQNNFLVEDVYEIIKLEKSNNGKKGTLKVLGSIYQ